MPDPRPLYHVTLACGCAYPLRQRAEWKPEPGDRMYCHRHQYEYHVVRVEERVEPPAPPDEGGMIWSE